MKTEAQQIRPVDVHPTHWRDWSNATQISLARH
jgi:hypothetical protein